jgi:hypothetical protein
MSYEFFAALFSLTPRFSGVVAQPRRLSTALAVYGEALARCWETAEAVELTIVRQATPLKRGVNEKIAQCQCDSKPVPN